MVYYLAKPTDLIKYSVQKKVEWRAFSRFPRQKLVKMLDIWYNKTMTYVIACGDEGVQLNEGTRLGFVGAGFRLDGFSEVVALLKKQLGKDIAIVSNEENEWVKQKLELSNWEQVNASSQQHIQAVADHEGLTYAGFLPFSDPKQLVEGVKGHMVRPHGIHIANKLCFTLGGGEQTFNLGRFIVSADWVAQAPIELVKKVLAAQIEFYTKLNRGEALEIIFESEGPLGPEVAAANQAVLEKCGYIAAV